MWIIPSTQQSIQKVVGYALKYFSRCGEDLWECIIEECQKVRFLFALLVDIVTDSLSGLDKPPHQHPTLPRRAM
jgi:hypothetical protein